MKILSLVTGSMVAIALTFSTPLDAAGRETATRIIAVGDVHGNLQGFRQILQASGLTDSNDNWIGGKATLVQVGDLLDRGADDRAILELMIQLERDARKDGGLVVSLLGNHEVMNLMGDLRYVSLESFQSFADDKSERRLERAFKEYQDYLKTQARLQGLQPPDFTPELEEKWREQHPPGFLEHREAFSPSGRYGRWLRRRPALVTINDIVFVHGGIHPKIRIELEDFNKVIASEIEAYDNIKDYLVDNKVILPFFDIEEMTRAVMNEADPLKAKAEAGYQLNPRESSYLEILERFLGYVNFLSFHQDGPLWYRGYAKWTEEEGSLLIDQLLEFHGVSHFVVGHTPQLPAQIRSRFDGKIVLIDTGMLSEYYEGGAPTALEIVDGRFEAIYLDRKQPLLNAEPEPVLSTLGPEDPAGRPFPLSRPAENVTQATVALGDAAAVRF